MKKAFVIILALCVSPVWAQSEQPDSTGNGEPTRRSRDRVREGRRERGPREDRTERPRREGERRRNWDQFQSATPDERRQMRLDQMVQQAARLYDLDDAQKEVVRSQIEMMQAERRAKMGAEADEYDQLRAKMFDHWRHARENAGERARDPKYWEEVRLDPQMQETRKRVRELEAKYPFNFDKQLKRIETLLPADQVAKGRERWDARNRGGDEGGRDMRRRAERERRARGDQAARGDRSPATVAPGNPLPPPKVAPPPHPWEIHTRRFIEQYQLTESQSAAAMGVLKDMRQRADQVEQLTASRLAAVSDSAGKKKLEDESKQQVESLFGELKQRLESLLTAAQRSAGAKP